LYLSEAEKELRSAVQDRDQLISDLRRGLEDRESAPMNGSTPALMQLMDSFVVGTKVRIEKAKHRIQICEKKVEKARKFYFEKHREKKVIEKLRDLEFQKYKKEKRRDEAKKIDEVYTVRSARRKAS